MKVIAILFILLLTAADMYLPPAAISKYLKTIPDQVTTCGIIYSEDEEGMIFEDSTELKCSLFEIRSLPDLSEGDVEFKIKFTKGSYTLKRSLAVPVTHGFKVTLEDLLTGQFFNLFSDSTYTFNVNRTIPDRFVIHVTKDSNTLSNK